MFNSPHQHFFLDDTEKVVSLVNPEVPWHSQTSSVWGDMEKGEGQ